MTHPPKKLPSSQMPSRKSGLALIALFIGMTIASYISLENGLRITSALVYVIAIVAIAANTNLRYGLTAAVLASVIYNFFLSEPLWKFGVDSYDDLMPLIAFNTTAIFTGILAGRLSERAIAAEIAQAKVRALLGMSDRLQQTVSLTDIARSVEDDDVDLFAGHICIYDGHGAPLGRGQPLDDATLDTVLGEKIYSYDGLHYSHYVLWMNDVSIAIVQFSNAQQDNENGLIDRDSLVNLIRLAAERCTLLKQQAEVESIRRSEELKTAILSSISHDMRTPLAAISASASSLSSLKATLEPDLQEKLLSTILAQCERLDRFTANLLNIGRLQSGMGDVNLQPVDLLDIIGAVLSGTRIRFPSNRIAKRFVDNELIISANEVMIEQIFTNILDNACRYGGSDGQVYVNATRDADHAVVSVTDFGAGIAPEDMPHLFERFFRGSRTSHLAGTGLGLAIARGFAEIFGGTISVDSPASHNIEGFLTASSAGPGTTVTVRIPLRLEMGLGERT